MKNFNPDYPISFEPSPVVIIPPGEARSLGQLIGWGQKTINTDELWKIGKGEGVVIGVIDTLDAFLHSDLKNRNPEKLRYNATGVPVKDPNWHGSHCAGIAAAEDNGIGRVGYAPQALLASIRNMLDNGSGKMEWGVEALRWFRELDLGKINPDWANYRKVASCSWGAPFPYKPLEEEIDKCDAAGVIVCAAAGNDPNKESYPGKYKKVLTVGSIGKALKRSSFSGPFADFVFPGEEIISCVGEDDLAAMWGTSMACPGVAGFVSCLISGYPELKTAAQVEQFIKENATRLKNDESEAAGAGVPLAEDFQEGPGEEKPEPPKPEPPKPEPPQPEEPGRTVSRSLYLRLDHSGRWKMPWRRPSDNKFSVLTIERVHIKIQTKADIDDAHALMESILDTFFRNKSLYVPDSYDAWDALYWTIVFLMRRNLAPYNLIISATARDDKGSVFFTDYTGHGTAKSAFTDKELRVDPMSALVFKQVTK